MEQYIPKSTLVAEIDRLDEFYHLSKGAGGQAFIEGILSFIDTLEVKEVDLEKYYHDFLQKEWFGNSHVRTVSEMMAFTAKHFFELGLNAQKGD